MSSIAEARKQIVSEVNGKPVTRGELADWFDLVKDETNWKNPIDILFAKDNLDEHGEAMIREAVSFFAGSTCHFIPASESYVRIQAKGYYLSIGA